MALHTPSDNSIEHTCDRCLITLLPFHVQPDLDVSFRQEISDDSLDDGPDEHLKALTSRANQLRLAHLNTQSMVSTFDELLLTISKYPFDVIAMSETWLKNSPHLLEYVNIPGYSSTFRNRDKIPGGGVGVYLRDTINYKRRTDIEDIEPELEHIWLEIPGKNKHSKLLLGVLYRSERIQDFQTWIDKTENLLSQLNVLWDGLLVVTGDMNIDLLKPELVQVKKYIDLLESLNLYQHVQHPTRTAPTSATLIDHIISNTPKPCHLL